MTITAQALLLCTLCFCLGPVSIMGGAYDWDWWMRSLGRLSVERYGREFARFHFIVFGVLLLALGAWGTIDALRPGSLGIPLYFRP